MRVIAALLLCVLLVGCAGGEYVSVKPHTDQGGWEQDGIIAVAGYQDMCDALAETVSNAGQSVVLSVDGQPDSTVDLNMRRAITYIQTKHPMGAYAVDKIRYELGTSRGVSAVAVTITYTHNRSELRRIKTAQDMNSAKELVGGALRQCANSLVFRLEQYTQVDFAQMVRDYADSNPAQVIEIPQVGVTVYPESGQERIVELQFTYQTPTDSLRSMQSYVQPVFAAASLYVSGEGEQRVKLEQVYSFLMERNDYKVETSLTPAYSLLRHGVGDSKAFSVVYTAMCRQSGLECQTIFGTKRGEPWYWNIVCLDNTYYHVDLLQSHGDGGYRLLTDEQMTGYVWDYSAYPACGVPVEQTDE